MSELSPHQPCPAAPTCPTPLACRAALRCRKRRPQAELAMLPTRVGIALVDHDDNVLENGPSFWVASELEQCELASSYVSLGTLVGPLLERYAKRVGIVIPPAPSPTATPQASSVAKPCQRCGQRPLLYVEVSENDCGHEACVLDSRTEAVANWGENDVAIAEEHGVVFSECGTNSLTVQPVPDSASR